MGTMIFTLIFTAKIQTKMQNKCITNNDRPFGCLIIYTDKNSQCYFVHRHINNVWLKNAHSLMGKPCLTIKIQMLFGGSTVFHEFWISPELYPNICNFCRSLLPFVGICVVIISKWPPLCHIFVVLVNSVKISRSERIPHAGLYW